MEHLNSETVYVYWKLMKNIAKLVKLCQGPEGEEEGGDREEVRRQRKEKDRNTGRGILDTQKSLCK